MSRPPSVAPALPDDVDLYLVLDDFGERLGRAWRETDEGRTDREIMVRDLLDGQYTNPVRVVAFSTAENWSRDVSEDIADELARLLAIEGIEHHARGAGNLPGSTRRQPAGSAAVTAAACGLMPIEYYRGRRLEPEELEAIRQQIEGFDTIDASGLRCAGSSSGIGRTWWPNRRRKILRTEPTCAQSEVAACPIFDRPDGWFPAIKAPCGEAAREA